MNPKVFPAPCSQSSSSAETAAREAKDKATAQHRPRSAAVEDDDGKRRSTIRRHVAAWALLLVGFAASCTGCDGCLEATRVPLVAVSANFTIADAVWFEDEATLFVFWRFEADQGLGETSRIELGIKTADNVVPTQPVSSYAPVHDHRAVDCGPRARCGSLSIALDQEPLSVPLRLRWHEDGELTLEQDAALTILRAGDPWKQRSAVVYGVFDESNRLVQWRLRHQFPNLRNEEVQELGLRRLFEIEDAAVGSLDPSDHARFQDNPWGYALLQACPSSFVAHPMEPLSTTKRAIFSTTPVEETLATEEVVCAQARVLDAKGTFETTALARRNPDVVPAFPFLRTPVAPARPLPFDFVTCNAEVSVAHHEMQRQRLLVGVEPRCVDGLDEPQRREELLAEMNAAIDAARAAGDDFVLSVVLNREDAATEIAVALESVLQDLLEEERRKTSPRAVGALVYDSAGYTQQLPATKPYLLWCPANFGVDDLVDVSDPNILNSLFHCAIGLDLSVPIDLPAPLDRLTVAQLPLLASRQQFLNYVARQGESAVGETNKLTFLAPRRGADARDVILGLVSASEDGADVPSEDVGADAGPLLPDDTNPPPADDVPFFPDDPALAFSTDIATFFDDEYLTLLPQETLSVCAQDASLVVVFQAQEDEEPASLAALPARHASDPQPRYQLGLRWDGAFYVRFDYRAVVGTATEVIGLTIPFSLSLPGVVSFREELWTRASFDLRKELLKCRRFCSHPTFDSVGIYQARQPFSPTFENDCYAPRFPKPGDGGFPDDP
jgi:hypothetical protein